MDVGSAFVDRVDEDLLDETHDGGVFDVDFAFVCQGRCFAQRHPFQEFVVLDQGGEGVVE